MVGKITKRLLLSSVLVLLLIQFSTSSPIENGLLEALMNRLDILQGKVDFLEAKDAKQEEKIIQLKAKIDAKPPLRSTDSSKMSSIYRKDGPVSEDSSTRAGPSSCRDLSLIGHVLDGLYLVQNPDTKKIQTVLCTFGTSISEDFVGNVDVKTKNVHFYVQKNATWGTPDSYIPFEVARLDEGQAMDLATGTFTCPVSGIYHFEFTGHKYGNSLDLDIILRVNNGNIGETWVNTALGDLHVVSLAASLRLKAGDRVNLFNTGDGILYDNADHYTHFTGWLVEEDLV